jgi:hypothetical protein
VRDSTLQPSDAPRPPVQAPPAVRYAIDANNHVQAADESLRALLPAGAPWPMVGRIVGEIAPNENVRDIYRGLHARVRAGVSLSVVQRFWGAPGEPRFVSELSPLPDHGILFELYPLPAADPASDADVDSEALLKICAWCLDVNIGRWLTTEHAVNRAGLLDLPAPRPVTHGICPTCLEQVKAEDD